MRCAGVWKVTVERKRFFRKKKIVVVVDVKERTVAIRLARIAKEMHLRGGAMLDPVFTKDCGECEFECLAKRRKTACLRIGERRTVMMFSEEEFFERWRFWR